ncbi:serine hydrolase [Sphingobium sp. CCH11-B1]|jgi:beta-lactamase class A|uniref:serine hydrolase n=1 Tax=Sphingobium sp. CCH11-B1 TaxID=1768781 RepID=UPI00082BCD9D|nr:serine hydrolase [Sphingobium sp. CCH11-B1]MEA3388861.1 serine hydrolase [Pseudomonadota bacterium]
MDFLRPISVLTAFSLFVAPLPGADAFGPPPKPLLQQTAEAKLLGEFARFATLSDGTVGIAVRDLQTGETQALNGDTLFPMASAYKVAVAGRIFALIDAGQLKLEDQLALDPALASEGGIAWMFSQPGAHLSVDRLLQLMMQKSDNNATDVLVARAGGPQAITQFVTGLGVRGLRVDSDTAHLLYRAMGIHPLSGTFRQNAEAARKADPQIAVRDIRDLPNIAFAAEPEDTSTPTAMLDLVTAFEAGRALSPASTQRLFTIMAGCETGKARIVGMLPPGTAVAHKTGSLNGVGNDVGVVRLPDGRRFAVVMFVMKDSKGHVSRDRVIAEAARAAYDYFLYAPDREHGRAHNA